MRKSISGFLIILFVFQLFLQHAGAVHVPGDSDSSRNSLVLSEPKQTDSVTIPMSATTPAPATSVDNPVSATVTAGSKPKLVMKATGYYIPPKGGYRTRHEARMEGGSKDCKGARLKPLQEYNHSNPDSYVSVAVDPSVISIGTWLLIDEFPEVRFRACDKGSRINGKKIDICCSSKKDTLKIPSTLQARVLKINDKGLNGFCRIVKKVSIIVAITSMFCGAPAA